MYIVKEAWRSPRGLSKLLFLLRPAVCNKTRVKVVGLCDSERGYGPLSERIIDQPPWDRDERFMLLYGLLNNRVEIHARALDLWSTAISKPGLTTFSSSWGAGRREEASSNMANATRRVLIEISFDDFVHFANRIERYRTIEGLNQLP